MHGAPEGEERGTRTDIVNGEDEVRPAPAGGALKRRLADEYDAAQDRGELARTRQHGPTGASSSSRSSRKKATAKDIGLTCFQIHEAREIRDSEEPEPGIVLRTKLCKLCRSLENGAKNPYVSRVCGGDVRPAEPGEPASSTVHNIRSSRRSHSHRRTDIHGYV